MKRALQVVGQSAEGSVVDAERLRANQRHVTVRDLGSGTAAARFASFMVDAGAERSTEGSPPDALAIVIRDGRAGGTSTEGNPEAGADYVLGSARPAFARWLVKALAPR